MKRLRYAVLVLLGLAGVTLIVGSLMPGTYDVQRTVEIRAPIEVVFAQVHDLRKHEAWAPWRKADPSYVFTYGDKTVGPGATMSWKGESSSGSMRMARSRPPNAIENHLHSPGMGDTIGHWTFEPSPAGTKVTWRFTGDISGPVGSWMAVFMDVMLGPFFDEGLASLTEVAEKAALPAEATATSP